MSKGAGTLLSLIRGWGCGDFGPAKDKSVLAPLQKFRDLCIAKKRMDPIGPVLAPSGAKHTSPGYKPWELETG